MSVVNKMLQDLEKRKKSERPSADYVPSSALAHSRASTRHAGSGINVSHTSNKHHSESFKGPVFKGLGFGLCCALAGFALLNWYQQSQDNRSTQVLAQALSAQNQALLESHLMLSQSQDAFFKTQTQNALGVQSQAPIEREADETETPDALESSSFERAMDKQSSKKQNLVSDDAATPILAQTSVLASANKSIQAQSSKAQITPVEENIEQGKQGAAEFSVAPSSGQTVSASALRESARIALANNDADKAISQLGVLIDAYPDDVRSRKQLASLLFAQQNIEQASKVLQAGLALKPSDDAMRIMLARAAFKSGQYSQAYEVLIAHPFEQLADLELISFRAAVAEHLNHYEQANKDYQLLISKEPQNAKWWLGLGVSHDKLARSEQALASYQRVQDLNQLPSQVSDFVRQRIAILAGQS